MESYEKRKEKFLKKLEKDGRFQLVGKYVTVKTTTTFKCKICGYKFKIKPNNILNKVQCINCNRKEIYHYDKLEKEFVRKLEERGKFKLIGEYFGSKNEKMQFQCLRCNHKFKTTYKEAMRKRYCPKCLKIVRRVGKDNKKAMTFTNPELAKNLLNKKDGNLYGENSKEKLKWKCKVCGTIIERSPISFRGSFKCKVCSDGLSYPNKFFASFLKEVNINYEPEKVFEWSKFENCSCFRYDFYIESKNMIIEVMGEQHYPSRSIFFGKTYEQTHENDCKKEELAKLNGIENYIKIDCRRTDFSFMKKSIIKEMNIFFDTDNLNWKNIKTRSLKNRLVEICEYYNNYKDVGTKELIKKFKTDCSTILRYLKMGAECGVCDYTLEDSHRREIVNRWKSIKENIKSDSELISKCYTNYNDIQVDELVKKFDMKKKRVIKCLLLGDKNGCCIFPKYKHLENKILQFTSDGKFIKGFESMTDAALEINVTIAGISANCKKKLLLCKNYIFRNNKID
jgi:hypothetical protein